MMILPLPADFSAEERAERAARSFFEGYNCCQSVLLAFSDLLPLSREDLLRVGSGFGGGMARMREVCGCVTATAMIAGYISPAEDPADQNAKRDNYALVQELAAAYREKMGSIVCREILGIRADAKQKGIEDPMPSPRTAEYYKSRPCARSCAVAGGILADWLLTHTDKKK